MNSKLSIELKAEAARLGFFACGIAPAKPINNTAKQQLLQWIERGFQADMHYMANHIDKRCDPNLLMPGVKSIVSVALNYTPAAQIPHDEWQIATYAYGEDYHEVVKNKLRTLANNMGFKEESHEARAADDNSKGRFRAFCDTAPILERYWAAQAGIGWIGRNHQLVIPGAGNQFLLGELFLDIELEYDQPQVDRCGTCRACIDACPTQALEYNGLLNANKCISYHTIESRNDLPQPIIEQMGNSIYGCDRCLNVCPWNRFAQPTNIEEMRPKPALLQMKKADWVQLSVENYRQLFRRSAVKRAKYEGLMRNIRAVATLSHQNDPA